MAIVGMLHQMPGAYFEDVLLVKKNWIFHIRTTNAILDESQGMDTRFENSAVRKKTKL